MSVAWRYYIKSYLPGDCIVVVVNPLINSMNIIWLHLNYNNSERTSMRCTKYEMEWAWDRTSMRRSSDDKQEKWELKCKQKWEQSMNVWWQCCYTVVNLRARVYVKRVSNVEQEDQRSKQYLQEYQENYDASGMYLIALKHEMPGHLSKHYPENHVSMPEPLFRMNASSIFLFDSIQMWQISALSNKEIYLVILCNRISLVCQWE